MAARLVARYPQPRSALLPLLYLVQSEEGYVSAEGIAFCSQTLGLTKAEVQAVSTFYEMFEREPVGDWLVSVCVNYSCKVRGGQDIYERWTSRLGGTASEDGKVHVKHLECLGNCEDAPVCQVNYNNYPRLTLEQADELLEAALNDRPPASVSGEVPSTFSETCWGLSGAADLELIHAAAVKAARADQVSYERPPAQRVLDEPHDLGAPGVNQPGPLVGDDTGVDAPRADERPAGERLDQPAHPDAADDTSDEGRGAQGDETPARTDGDERGEGESEQPSAEEQPVETQSGTGDADTSGSGAPASGSEDESRRGDTAGPRTETSGDVAGGGGGPASRGDDGGSSGRDV